MGNWIFGIDPSIRDVGWAVLNGKGKLVAFGEVSSRKKEDGERLLDIHYQLLALFSKWKKIRPYTVVAEGPHPGALLAGVNIQERGRRMKTISGIANRIFKLSVATGLEVATLIGDGTQNVKVRTGWKGSKNNVSLMNEWMILSQDKSLVPAKWRKKKLNEHELNAVMLAFNEYKKQKLENL